MLATVDIGVHGPAEEILDPGSIFMSLFDGLEKDPAKLLHIVLLKGFLIVPLKAFEQVFGVRRFVGSLQEHKQLLQLVGNTILFLYLFGVVPR